MFTPNLAKTPLFFSVVIPTYNRVHLLERAVRSCLAQSFNDFEIVIVDDGSSDGTREIVERIGDPRVAYVHQANLGGGAARNTGAEASRGLYLAFLDSDDEFLPGKLEAFHRAISCVPDQATRTVWYSQLWFQRGSGNRLRKPSRAIRPGERVGDYLFAYEGLMQTSTLVVPRTLFEEVRFDPRLRRLQDLDLCLRLEAAGARFAMLPEPQVIWHDETAYDRVSYATTAVNMLEWVEANRSLLSERAYWGFLGRYAAPVVARREPVKAACFLLAAFLRGSVSVPRAASILARAMMPSAYSRFRDAVVTLRGA